MKELIDIYTKAAALTKKNLMESRASSVVEALRTARDWISIKNLFVEADANDSHLFNEAEKMEFNDDLYKMSEKLGTSKKYRRDWRWQNRDYHDFSNMENNKLDRAEATCLSDYSTQTQQMFPYQRKILRVMFGKIESVLNENAKKARVK